MELSSQHANGSDPFNLCQKHTDEEVPNARPLPWGRHTPPLAAPFLLLDSLTGAPHLSSFTVQSGETGRLASGRLLHMPLMHTRRTQGHSQRNGPDAGRADEGPVRDGIDTYRIHGPWQAMRICPPPLASGANMWKLAWGYGAQPMEEEAEGQRRESIPNRRG
ncbi:hypothetical protein JOQ06_002821, partial [Pogonophryne albipinna]